MGRYYGCVVSLNRLPWLIDDEALFSKGARVAADGDKGIAAIK